MVRQGGSRRFRCRRVNVESRKDGNDRVTIDGDMTALPVPVLSGDAKCLSQVVDGRVDCWAVKFWHGANLGRVSDPVGGELSAATSRSSARNKEVHDQPGDWGGYQEGIKSIHNAAVPGEE